MAVGLAAGTANNILDAMGNASSFSLAAVWIQLHSADPGAAGTTSVIAAFGGRQQASFAAASSGSIATDAALTWTGVTGNPDPTHFSAWSASTAGTFWFSGTVTTDPSGSTFTIPAGSLSFQLTSIAA